MKPTESLIHPQRLVLWERAGHLEHEFNSGQDQQEKQKHKIRLRKKKKGWRIEKYSSVFNQPNNTE